MIRFLLSSYPKAWRAEYGEELRSLLFSRRLTPSICLNVLWNGLGERVRAANPVRFCSLVFSLTFIVLTLEFRGQPAMFHWVGTLFQIFLLAATVVAWTRSRGATVIRGFWNALTAGITLAFMCANIFFGAGSRFFRGTGVMRTFFFPVPLAEQLFVLFSALLVANLAGALVGLGIARVRGDRGV